MNQPIEPISEQFIQEAHKLLLQDHEAMAYLRGERKLSRETIERFRLGLSFRNGNRWLVIPYFSNGNLINIKFRSLPPAPKAFLRAEGYPSTLFNEDALNGTEEAFVCEGEIDTITLVQNGFPNAVGVTCGAETFLPEWIDRFANIKRIFSATILTKPGNEGQGRRQSF